MAATEPARGRVIRHEYIGRWLVRNNRNKLFVFGDNMERQGFKGQAAEMRGEPNAIGVPVKWAPRRDEAAYFTDADLTNPEVRRAIGGAFRLMQEAIEAGKDVVIPADGLGTGLAQLPHRAPAVHAWIELNIRQLSGET